MKKQVNSWEEVYQLPFHLDKYGSYVWSHNGTMSLMFDSNVTQKDREKIVNAINKTSDKTIDGVITTMGSEFYVDGNYMFCVRGWGHLTGVGALNLSEEKALEIQDSFIRYVKDCLKCKRCAGTGWESYPNHSTTPPPCPDCQQ